jgi:hypothetical protein
MIGRITLIEVEILLSRSKTRGQIATKSRNYAGKNARNLGSRKLFSQCKDKTISVVIYFLNFTEILRNIVGSKNKLKRFRENETFDNVFQPSREEIVSGEFPLRGKWNTDFFKNENPLVLELGCGKGEYSV